MPRLVATLIALCTALFSARSGSAQLPADQPCRIEGQVLSVATGAPLKNTTLRVSISGDVPSNHSVNDPDNFETVSGAEGRFLFDAIPHAEYSLKAERNGYLSYDHDPDLDCAGENRNVLVKLTPQGIISGHVVDDDGEPVPGAVVEIMRRIWVDGVRTLRPAIETANETTHADGGFAVGGLPPGRYYIRASHRKEQDDPAELGRKGAIKEAFVPTFFPASLDVTGATPIDVGAGSQVPGIDIKLKKSRAFRVSGKVKMSLTQPVRGDIELVLRQPGGPPAVPSTGLDQDRFEFRDILPGFYTLRSDAKTSTELFGSMPVMVTDEDVRDVLLTLAPPIELKVTVEGARSSRPFLFFLPADGRIPERSWLPNREGKLTVELPSGTYRLLVVHPGYLKSIRLNQQEVSPEKIDLAGAGTLDLAISLDGGEINPVVRDADGRPALHPRIQVCDLGGTCTARFAQQLAPGDYRVYAWADDGDGIIDVPEFRAAFESQCAKVKLEEKSHETVELKLITKQSMEAEAAKIP